jgi:hypothetical protein
VCAKYGHTAIKCWKRFNKDYIGEEKPAGSGSVSAYGVDTNWYLDTGATDHFTGDLEKLTVRDRYHEHEQIHAANGSCMDISHIGHAIIRTPREKHLKLKNVLHSPQASKSLVSAHKLACDKRGIC